MRYYIAIAIMSFAVPAFAAPAMVPTNLPGVMAFPAPPEGFDPIAASDADLRAYGFPPRPNPFRDRRAYAGWRRLVRAGRVRIDPQLQVSEVRHGKMRKAGGALAQANASYSTNWSGDALSNGATGFGSTSFYTLWGEFNVPIAQPPFGNCGSTWYSATWIGMDGYNGGRDLVQAGTESDATCQGGSTTGSYYAWYEWYPANEVRISNFPVYPGDDIGVQVGVSNTTAATVYITNETTNQYAAIGFNAPPGTQFVGNTAEWIVERPEVNHVLTNLQNYVTDYVSNTIVLLNNANHSAVFATGAPGIPYSAVTMLDKSGNPLSVPQVLSGASIVCHDAGAAK